MNLGNSVPRRQTTTFPSYAEGYRRPQNRTRIAANRISRWPLVLFAYHWADSAKQPGRRYRRVTRDVENQENEK